MSGTDVATRHQIWQSSTVKVQCFTQTESRCIPAAGKDVTRGFFFVLLLLFCLFVYLFLDFKWETWLWSWTLLCGCSCQSSLGTIITLVDVDTLNRTTQHDTVGPCVLSSLFGLVVWTWLEWCKVIHSQYILRLTALPQNDFWWRSLLKRMSRAGGRTATWNAASAVGIEPAVPSTPWCLLRTRQPHHSAAFSESN